MIGAGSPEFYLLVTLFLCVQWERFSITRFTAADRRWSSRMVAVINLENGNPGLNPHHRMAFPLMYGYTSEKYPRCINTKVSWNYKPEASLVAAVHAPIRKAFLPKAFLSFSTNKVRCSRSRRVEAA
jgi:hypothetical protein